MHHFTRVEQKVPDNSEVNKSLTNRTCFKSPFWRLEFGSGF